MLSKKVQERFGSSGSVLERKIGADFAIARQTDRQNCRCLQDWRRLNERLGAIIGGA
jgi:hypothetical protein